METKTHFPWVREGTFHLALANCILCYQSTSHCRVCCYSYISSFTSVREADMTLVQGVKTARYFRGGGDTEDNVSKTVAIQGWESLEFSILRLDRKFIGSDTKSPSLREPVIKSSVSPSLAHLLSDKEP